MSKSLHELRLELRLDCYNRIRDLIKTEKERLDNSSEEIPWAMTDNFSPLKAVPVDYVNNSLLHVEREIAEILRDTFPIDN